MDQKQILEKIISVIKPFVKNQEAIVTVKNETKILEDLGVNSARLVDIVLAFEDAFNIEIDDDAADNIWTIGDAVNLISAKVA